VRGVAVAAVFFDVDGTLVPGPSSAQYLAGFLGHGATVAAAEADWDAGRVSSEYVERADGAGWAGATPGQVREWLAGLPLVAGIAEVVAWCERREVLTALATLAWAPVGAYLCDTYGFAAASGPRLELAESRFTGEVAEHCDEFAKRDFAVALAAAAGLGMDRVAAVGDSRSDVPLFEAASLAVSFNGDAHLTELADAHVSGHDLRAVLPALESWLAGLP
jgi:phosphoserine phosphatase